MVNPRLPAPLLIAAYSSGYFPMPHPETGEIMWLRPDPRAILRLDKFHVSRSLAQSLKKGNFEITFDQAFLKVMRACADRPEGSWIIDAFYVGYEELHKQGHAHCVEVWRNSRLIGGVYGVSLGGAFFAESKFHRVTDASKIALYHLIRRLREKQFSLLEVQFLTPHLRSLGAEEISDAQYQLRLSEALKIEVSF